MSSDIRLDTASVSVDQLLARVRTGEIRVPEFQRNFTWRRPDVQKLIDSVHKSFPIGTLLVWKKPGPAERLRLGGLTIDAHASENVWWVVDGQQRVTTLGNLLVAASSASPFNVAFDVEKGTWSVPRAETLALSTAVNSEGLLDWLAARTLSAEARKRAIQLGAALKEYRVPVWVVETGDETAIREIFGRLNSLGRKLKPDQIFEALERKPATSLTAVAQRLSALGFGKIENKLIHQTLLAYQGDDFTSDRVGRARSPESFAKVELGLSNSIAFLRDAGVPHIKLLPYNFALVLLGALFANYPVLHPRNRELLTRWFWRSSVSQQASGSDLAWLRAALRAFSLPEHRAVQALVRSTLKPPLPESLSHFDLRRGSTRLEVLAALFLSGSGSLPQDVARAIERGVPFFRELLPVRKTVRMVKATGRPLEPDSLLHDLNSIAGRAFVVDGKIIAAAPIAEEQLLMQVATVTNRIEAAKAAVPKMLAALRSFLSMRMANDENDRPPLEALTLPDEDIDAA